MEPNPRCGPSWCDGSLIFLRDSPPPLYHPDIVADVRAVSPRSLALFQLTLAVLSQSALEIIPDPGPSSLFIFSYWIDVDRLFFRDQPLSSERFCFAPVRPAIREGDFLVSICPEVRGSSVPALQDSLALLWLLSVGMVDQYVTLCFSTVTYPSGSPELQWSL